MGVSGVTMWTEWAYGKGRTVVIRPEQDEETWSSASVQLKFRIRKHLRDRLADAANERGVTMNAEITIRLNESFDLAGYLARVEERLRDAENQLRDEVEKFQAREARYLERERQLTDHLLQLTTPHLRGRKP
jgi:Arc-like DNA binding domain